MTNKQRWAVITAITLASIGICITTLPADAANTATYTLDTVTRPTHVPKKYLYMYQGNLYEYGYRTRREVRAACRALGMANDFGCAEWNDDRTSCTIVYLAGLPHVYWHEIAHCNGYKHE